MVGLGFRSGMRLGRFVRRQERSRIDLAERALPHTLSAIVYSAVNFAFVTIRDALAAVVSRSRILLMRSPSKIRLVELDEDVEPCGERFVINDENVIASTQRPGMAECYRLGVSDSFLYVSEIEIGWFAHEEEPEYEIANKSTHYLAVYVTLQKLETVSYITAWSIFRESGVPLLLKSLRMKSWAIGKGIVDRRGQDLFAIELDGFDAPAWIICTTIKPSDSFGDCMGRARKIEAWARDEFAKQLLELAPLDASIDPPNSHRAGNGGKAPCYICRIFDPNETHYDPQKHGVCGICAVKLWELAQYQLEFELRDQTVKVAAGIATTKRQIHLTNGALIDLGDEEGFVHLFNAVIGTIVERMEGTKEFNEQGWGLINDVCICELHFVAGQLFRAGSSLDIAFLLDEFRVHWDSLAEQLRDNDQA